MLNVLKFLFVTVPLGVILWLFVAAFFSPAKADVVLDGYTPVYTEIKHYETVEICTKGDDKTTEGAIVGGLIGSQEGKAGIGALIGAIIGNEIGSERCHTEKRVSHTSQEFSHYEVTLIVDGKEKLIRVTP